MNGMDYKTFLQEASKRRAEIKKLREMDWTWRRIADQYGITPQRAQQLGAKTASEKANPS